MMCSCGRLIQGMAKRGTVVKIIKTGSVAGRAVVNIGTREEPNLTPPIQWCVESAGTINTQRIPSIGEQVVMLNTGGGDCLSDLVIIGYLHSTQYPAPSMDEDKKTVAAGGYSESYTTEGAKVEKSKTTTTTSESTTATSNSYSITAQINLTGDTTQNGSVEISDGLKASEIDMVKHVHPETGKVTQGPQ